MINFILQILSKIGEYFTGKKLEIWKRTQDKRENHLRDIQEKVFKPILKILEDHWLLIVERKRVCLGIDERKTYENNSVGHDLISIKYLIVTYGESVLSKPNPYLYKDAIDNHFTPVLKDYESFKLTANQYINDCLSYAEEVKNLLTQRISLQEYDPFANRNINQEEWIRSSHLAIYIVREQMLLSNLNSVLKVEDNPVQPALKVIKEFYWELVQCLNPKKIGEIIHEIISKKDRANELISSANKLSSVVLSIKDEMEKLCLSGNITGDCDFIKL